MNYKDNHIPPAEEPSDWEELDLDQLPEFSDEPVLDPALQSPLPRFRTAASDPEAQRLSAAWESLPERQIPEPVSQDPPDLQDPPDPQDPLGPLGPLDAPDPGESEPVEENVPEPAPDEPLVEDIPLKSSRKGRKVEDAPKSSRKAGRKPEAPVLFPREPAGWNLRLKPRTKPRFRMPRLRKEPAPPASPEAQCLRAEKRQKGRGLRLGFALFLALGSLALAFCRAQGLLDFYATPSYLTFMELAVLLLSCASCYDVLAQGFRRLAGPGFGWYTLLCCLAPLSLIDGVLAMQVPRSSYCPVVCLLLACGLWGLRLRDRAVCDSMAPARQGAGGQALVREPGLWKDEAGILQGPGDLSAFLRDCGQTPGPLRLLDGYCLAVLLAGGILAGVTCQGSIPDFLQYWTAACLAGTPLLGGLIWARPWAILSRRLGKLNAALYGWPGAKRLRGALAVPISDRDLFPQGNLKLNGVKYYGAYPPDRVVAYGAAVIGTAQGDLGELFAQQLDLRGGRRYAVTRLRRYDAGGISGEIGDDTVLVGSLRFMQSMGVDMPAGTRVSQAVYVAICGDLAGVFAIHYGTSRSTSEALASLIACRGVTPLVTAEDFIINESFLRSKFRVDAGKLKLPPFPQRAELAQRRCSPEAQPCALIGTPGFEATALAVAGGRALNTAVRWGTAVSLLGGLMGMGILGVLAFLAAGGVMSLTNLALYLLVWAVPQMLLSGWTRNA